ncbi:MAG: prepilin-type N-terminal cleavage/methylation domain-containing protein [Ruminococcus sp.]|nr:prepilin-type N-terminal cleavage/methylation domain-containing protein [Ruminococcus sp.]MCM1380420.1 prepilin-type N-terminal cleavage/methylation domain-containing protein [Muribaculaceae bacterium]MCM1478912.1 prepilin-type N-terminal cleavage/methylation domain-containing protein [Muribaculaceae bacterium]
MKKFKGFTLVECLVAMAILAIAGTLMASIYANVSTRNNYNNFNNTSLANQMKYVENYEKINTAKIANTYSSASTPPSGTNSGTNAYVKVTKGSDTYTFPVDIYIMYSRDKDSKKSTDSDYGAIADNFSTNSTDKNSDGENRSNLRYRYLLGH